MVNYYDCFVRNLTSNCAVLNNLLQKNKQWNWTSEHTKAVKSVKHLLTSVDTFSHYDPAVPISLSCDASPVGIGAVIFHTFSDGTEKPIVYASCKLTAAEQNYAQIQKEALGIVFGVQKFSSVPTGMEVSIDHRS